MNRGFKTYFKEGRKAAKKAFKHKKLNFFKYYMWMFVQFFSMILLFAYPPFALADVSLARQAKEEGKLEIFGAFKNADNPKTYLGLLFSMIVKGLIIVCTVLLIAIIGALMGFVGYTIGTITGSEVLIVILTAVFALPSVITIIIVVITMTLLLSPVVYTFHKDENVSMNNALYSSALSMSKKGKKTLFAFDIVFIAIPNIIYSLIVTALIVLIRLGSDILISVGVVLLILVTFMYLLKIPKLVLGRSIAKLSLFDDLVTITDSGEKSSENEEIVDAAVKKKSKIRKKVIKTEKPEELLVSMFSDNSVKTVTDKDK